MREVRVEATVSARADDAYRRLADFPAYVDLASSVLAVTMGDGNATSEWEVTFRDGVLRWQEEDIYDPQERLISFSQIDGDMDTFSGGWQVREHPQGARIVFVATFDLGLPGLSDFLEPVAARALEENLVELLSSLFADDGPQISAPCLNEPTAIAPRSA